MSRTVTGTVIGSGLLFVALTSSALAQSPIEIRATAPEKPQLFRIVEPSEATRESTRPREADFYREDVRVRRAGVHRAVRGPDAGRHQVRAVGLDLTYHAGRQLRLAGALGPEWMARAGIHGGMGFGAGGLDPARVQSPLSRGA